MVVLLSPCDSLAMRARVKSRLGKRANYGQIYPKLDRRYEWIDTFRRYETRSELPCFSACK